MSDVIYVTRNNSRVTVHPGRVDLFRWIPSEDGEWWHLHKRGRDGRMKKHAPTAPLKRSKRR